MDILIYDTEIINCIPPKGMELSHGITHGQDGLNYCGGWKDFSHMGISVIGAWHSTQGLMSWTNESNQIPFEDAHFLAVANHCDVIVGFNSHGFDDRLLAANGMPIRSNYDLLEEVRIAAGFGADFSSVRKGYSYALDAIARANGMAKTGTGQLAPVLWQTGRREEVTSYCLNDVEITRRILFLGLKGKLIDPNTRELLKLRGLPNADGKA